MAKHGTTLAEIQKDLKQEASHGTAKVIRVEDVTTPEERKLMAERRKNVAKSKRKFDDVDAYIAEIIVRFGYDAYIAWNRGEISMERMTRLLRAERAREASEQMELYGIIMSMVGACVKRYKGQPAPKGPRVATKIFKTVEKIAKGD